MPLQPSLNILLAQRLLGSYDSRRLVDWAGAALADGYLTGRLTELAGMADAPVVERERCFLEAITELDLALDADRDTLLRNYATYLARRVAKGYLEHTAALTDLQAIYVASDYDSRYQAFYLLAEDLAALHAGNTTVLTRDLTRENASNVISCACTDFLSWEAVGINPHRWGAVYCFSCGHVDASPQKANWLNGQRPRYVCSHCGSGRVGDFSEAEDRHRILEAASRRA